MSNRDDADRRANQTIALGALFAILAHHPGVASASISADPFGALVVRFDFLRSPYRLTVAQLGDDDGRMPLDEPENPTRRRDTP